MESHSSEQSVHLVFGDLHGRILPAFRLASAWSRDFNRRVDGILQVGDLGWFPDISRLDKATIRHAADDPLELGAADVAVPNSFADEIFRDPHVPVTLRFTAGNHEDFEDLERAAAGSRTAEFTVDAYSRVIGIKDGCVASIENGPKVGAIWGVDGEGRNRRTNLPSRGYISTKAIDRLLVTPHDVLLCHDSPYEAARPGYGSVLLDSLIRLAKPTFAFFGHYRGKGAISLVDFGNSSVYHMAGFELRGRDGTPEEGSIGVLTWRGDGGTFKYLDQDWLSTFSRWNWKWR